jgi:pimeloyl-ACP methyl ester carboxylesterase
MPERSARPEPARNDPGPIRCDPLTAYLVDAAQRTVLFWDVMRQRGNRYAEHMAQEVPNVLQFDAELIVDGRTLPRPVNYGLVAIKPPNGIRLDPRRRPFVIVDPRAGHGPGIGGFKADSEIGVALAAGHPCYFIGFSPTPMPGQTIEDVMNAEAVFLTKVIERHPESEGRPVVIGNCQGGWAVLMLAAAHPERCGPIIAAGAPLAYWAGVRGVNPMRYLGGSLGGSWLTALAGDLGDGLFDGAHLVGNFENNNPSNTLWTKHYKVYAKVDTEAPRYLGFERWWGGHVLLNAEEMQWIADNLFIGNKLATAEIVTRDGVRIDLRNITSPIIVFCSWGDDITPPQQALGWIPDLYDSVDDIRANGQTIVYCIHESIGHLGIFVSADVAKREHHEFASNIDFIDCLPPGLYEAVITPVAAAGDVDPGLASDGFLIRFEHRSVDAIRALGGNDRDDERKFAAVKRLSEVNLGLYRTFVQPWLRTMVSAGTAETLRRLHPARLPYALLSDRNPWLAALAPLAEQVRYERRPAAADNPFVVLQELAAKQIVAALDGWRDLRDRTAEMAFHAFYGSPFVQAALGLRHDDSPPRRRPGRDPEEIAFVARRAAELRQKFAVGGPREAFIRAVVYVRAPTLAADERSYLMLRKIREEHASDVTLAQFKAMLRDQFMLVMLDHEAAIATLPGLLDGQLARPQEALDLLRAVVTAPGELPEESLRRLARVAKVYSSVEPRSTDDAPSASPAPSARRAGPKTGSRAKAALG